MDIDEEFSLGTHLLLHERKCRVCGVENLVDNFYRTRKDRGIRIFFILI